MSYRYRCNVCGSQTVDNDTAALGGAVISETTVPHDAFCPGAVFVDKHVRRIEWH